MPARQPTTTSRADYTEGWSYIPADAVIDPDTGMIADALTGDPLPGAEYRLDKVVGRYVLNVSGLGLPPITYPTQRGPYQHGVTPLDYFLEPRVLQLGIRQVYQNRASFWGNAIPNPPGAVSAPSYGQGRGGLLNALRPNKMGAAASAFPYWQTGRLRFYRSPLPSRPFAGQSIIDLSGDKLQPEMLDIDVLVTEALSGITPTPDVWDQWAFSDVIRFIAHDPLFYYPVRQAVSVEAGVTGAWDITLEVPYFGTWSEYPIIVFDAVGGGAPPLASAELHVLRHSIVRQTINLTATPGTAAETYVTFDLRYGHKTVASSPVANVNLLPYLSEDSELATFRLEPFPVAASGGVNVIRVQATGVIPATRMTVYYYHRYLGI